MKPSLAAFFSIALLATLAPLLHAQKVPETGYVFPPGGKAGTTVAVRLGGYNWTPDMDYFTHDKRVTLQASGPPGPLLIPGPPYWFGAKGRIGALPLPREVTAKFVIPAGIAGPIYWHAANANGGTSAGVFIVGTGTEVVEEEDRKSPQLLPALPVTVSGRIRKIEEVDRYRFIAPRDGPITCELMARRLGAKFLGVVEVRDSTGQRQADVAGTNGSDPSLTFVAKAKAEYVVSVHDVDFGGDRSFVYRLSLTDGPRVVGALPAAGKRGETREVEFIGIGVASGTAKLESVKRRVTFPATPTGTFDYRLVTPWGTAPAFPLQLSDLTESVAAPRVATKAQPLHLPGAISGVLDQPEAQDCFACTWKKGEVWSLALEARRIGSPLDVALTVLGSDGKEIARNDDLPGTTDAGLDFTVPADGIYQLVVSDMAGKSGSRDALYRLVVQKRPDDFGLLLTSQRLSVPLSVKTNLVVQAVRHGNFKGPIALTVRGLPAGVTVPPNLVIPAGKADLIVPISVAADAATAGGIVHVEGTATVSSKVVTRPALVSAGVNLAPLSPTEEMVPGLLVAVTMKPRFKGRPVDQDTGRKVHRGATFPAEVIVERLDGFAGEIILQMASQQSYQVQGITGSDVIVPNGVSRTLYPCFMPEWLETSRTSRMGVVGVVRVPDPKGKIRHLVGEITGFITMSIEGGLMKISAEDNDLTLPTSQAFDVRLKVVRIKSLTDPVRVELRLPESQKGQFETKPVVLSGKLEKAVLHITPAKGLTGSHTIMIRATAMQEGKYAVISETPISVELIASNAAAQVSAVTPRPHADAPALRKIAQIAGDAKWDGEPQRLASRQQLKMLAAKLTDPKVRTEMERFLPSLEKAAQRYASDRLLLAEIKRLGGKEKVEVVAPDWLHAITGDEGFAVLGRLTEIELNERTDGHKAPVPKKLTDRVTDDWLKHLVGQDQLRRLELSGTAVTSVGLIHLKDLKSLQILNVCLTAVDDRGLAHLSGLTEMQRMIVCSSKVTGSGFAHLSGMKKLISINLHSSPASDAGLKAIGKLTSLYRLEIVHTNVTDAGLKHLASLVNLRQLHVASHNTTETALPFLGQLKELTQLDVYERAASNQTLAEIGKLSKLRLLMLTGGNFDDDAVKHLSRLTTLEELSLGSSKMTDKALEHLAGLRNLRKLHLGGTRVTTAGRQRLQKMLPKVMISP